MDPLSATGLVLALVGGSILKGSGLAALWNGAAFVIVVVGTFASSLIQTPRPTFVRAMRIFSWVFKPPPSDLQGLIERVVEWSNMARKQGLLALGIRTRSWSGRGNS